MINCEPCTEGLKQGWPFSTVLFFDYLQPVSFSQFTSKVNRVNDFCKTDKIAEGALIQYLQKKVLAPKDIHADMVATLRKDVLFICCCKKVDGSF